jgi:predicted PurR-regulated permease PerM
MMPAPDSPPPPAAAAPRGLRIVAFVAVLALLSYGQAFFVTLFFALFLSLALRPFVSLLEGRLPAYPRSCLVLAILIGAVALLIVNVSAQLQQFYLDLRCTRARSAR